MQSLLDTSIFSPQFGPMSDLINEADNDGYTPVLLTFEALAISACKEVCIIKDFIHFSNCFNPVQARFAQIFKPRR